MRKALCFAVLALFLAVSMASSIHAASYPSGAPLPQFQVSSASGYAHEPGVQSVIAKFGAKILNYQDVKNWVLQIDPSCDRLSFHLSDRGGIIQFDENGVFGRIFGDVDFREESYGKWNRLEFTEMSNPAFTFATPIYFCDVYVPPFSDMPFMEWTDLQFKQTKPTQPIIPNEILIPLLVACVVAVGLVVAVRQKKF